MKKILFTITSILFFLVAMAQESKVVVSGAVYDGNSNIPVEMATVQLLSLPDSTYINGNVTSKSGYFTLPAVKPGAYLLKVSYVGYTPQFKTLQLVAARPKVTVGRISIHEDGILLQEAVVTAEAPQVQVVEDTIVFNASAYRVPEGSMLEELVKKLPGAEVDESGNITVNGKTISKVLLDGKEFFADEKDMALKNLPVDMVEKLKTYDRKSDLARITGIDDGEEETVLDLTVKKGMKKGWFGNADLAAGTKERYSSKVMVNRFADDLQMSAIGSAGNANDNSFGNKWGGFRGNNNGLRTRKMGGFNMAISTPKLEAGGSINYMYNLNDTESKTATEKFLSSGNSFSNALGKDLSRSTAWNGDFRFEWKPNSLTNIILRPRFKFSTTNSYANTESATFNADPYTYSADPLSDVQTSEELSTVRVNHQENKTQSEGNSNSASAELQVNRKMGVKGRNITLRATGSTATSKSTSISQALIAYYLYGDSTTFTNRYATTPTRNWDYSAQLTYSEPILSSNTFLQFSYKFQYKYSKSDRATYNVPSLYDFPTHMGDLTTYLPVGYDDAANYDADQSKMAQYRNFIHEGAVSLLFVRTKYQLNAGFTVMPQESNLKYKKGDVDTITVRNVTNFTPTLDFRYRFSKQTQLRVNYRGTTSQPSMTDLLDITDDANPLAITKGNPGLKPSFSNNLMAMFNTYNGERQQGIHAGMVFNNTLNSISNKVSYDSETGGTVTQPENINGNWDLNGRFGLSGAIKNHTKFSYNTHTSATYRNMVAYLSQDQADAVKNTTRRTNLSERLSGSYRNNWFDVGVNGSVAYSHVRSALQESSNMDTYDFSYGAEANVTLPWKMSFSTSLSNSCRRGYSDASMNRNELVWNMQLSQSFLKGNAATITLQVYDVLHQQSNISRTITASARSDAEYNMINSYCMIHFIYRLNVFGSKELREKMREAHRKNFDGGNGFGGGFIPGGGNFGGGGPPM